MEVLVIQYITSLSGISCPHSLHCKWKRCLKLPSLDNTDFRTSLIRQPTMDSCMWKLYINMDVMLILPSVTILFCSRDISGWHIQRCGEVFLIIYCVPVEQYNCCNQGSNSQLLSLSVHPLVWNVMPQWYLQPSFHF